MTEKLVSVIITTFGRAEKMIFEAIDSVRKQTYKNIEIIVVDDNGLGSDCQKNNEKIFKKEPDIKYIANKKNSGAQVSRNIGILASAGEYIACLDDDDIWMPEKIEKQVALMETENLALVYCNGYRFYNNDKNEKKLYQFNFISDREIDFSTELMADHIGSTSIPLMRKECLAQTGLFDVDMPARQDYEMWLRFCRFFKVKGINEPLFYYRYHKGARISHDYTKEIRCNQLLLKKYKDDYKKNRIAKTNILFTLCKVYIKSKHWIYGAFFCIQALLCSPTTVFNVIKNHLAHKAQF